MSRCVYWYVCPHDHGKKCFKCEEAVRLEDVRPTPKKPWKKRE